MKNAVAGKRLDDRHPEKLEQAQGPFVASRDLSADEEGVGRAIAGEEADQAVAVQLAALRCRRLPDGFVGLSDDV